MPGASSPRISIHVSHILSGRCLAKIDWRSADPHNLTALCYNEVRTATCPALRAATCPALRGATYPALRVATCPALGKTAPSVHWPVRVCAP